MVEGSLCQGLFYGTALANVVFPARFAEPTPLEPQVGCMVLYVFKHTIEVSIGGLAEGVRAIIEFSRGSEGLSICMQLSTAVSTWVRIQLVDTPAIAESVLLTQGSYCAH